MKKFVFGVLLLFLVSCASDLKNPVRFGSGVWFILEGRKVTALHVVERPDVFNVNAEDIFIGEKVSERGFQIYKGKVILSMEKPFHRVFFLIPEFGKVEGYIFRNGSEKWSAKFKLPVEGGFSGSPVFDFKTGKVLGLISAFGRDGRGMEVTLIQKLLPEDLEK